MIEQIKWRMEKLTQGHPVLYFWTKRALEYVDIALPHDQDFHGLKMLADLQPGGTFLDVGANDGISARSFRKLVKGYSIVSIEPNPFHTASLERVKRHDPLFRYVLTGASDRAGHLELFVPFYRKVPIHSAASLRAETALENLAKVYKPSIVRKLKMQPVCVPVKPIDDLELSPDLIKVDVEGHDYSAICGMRNTLKRCQPAVLFESSEENIGLLEAFFEELDYDIFAFNQESSRFVRDRSRSSSKNLFAIPKRIQQLTRWPAYTDI